MWRPGDGLAGEYGEMARAQGYEVVTFSPYARLPEGLDVVLAVGPYGTLVPLISQLSARPPARRPAFAYVMTEQLPNPDLPEWFRYGAGVLRSWAGRKASRAAGNGAWQAVPALKWMARKATRFGYYGDLYWMRRAGVLSVLAVWSRVTADFLKERGFPAMVPSEGYSPGWGDDLGLARDIPVLWLGKAGSRRRARVLQRLRGELRERGVEVHVVDGVEHSYVFGPQRTELLNRTQIMLNLVREKWDDNSLRFCLAAANKALIVSEPMLPHSSFRPGVHLVEAPIDQLAGIICRYLDDEAARRQITGRAYELVRGRPFGQGIREVLERALGSRPAGETGG
jgi:hypothetical protein